MTRQADRLARHVDDLMDVSRITHGMIEMQTEPIDVNTVLARAAESVRPHVEARRHTLIVRAAGEPAWITADPLRLEQVLTNLLTNAVKYTYPGGQIELSARHQKDHDAERVCLIVKDNGIGISAALVPHVFDLFMQVDHSAEKSQGGLGIGLTLVRKLVELQGGTISLTSGGPGLGTEVSVSFPAIAARVGAPVPGERSTPTPSDLARRVLIVDDNDDAAVMLAELIGVWGHETRVVGDGASAIAESEFFRPDVVILDIGLPDMSGYVVAARIKQRQVLRPPLLIALTGYGQPADRQRSTEAGFDHHLVKPVDVDRIEELLRATGSDN